MRVCDRCRGEEKVADVVVNGGDKQLQMELCAPCRITFTGVVTSFTAAKGDVELAAKVVAAKPGKV